MKNLKVIRIIIIVCIALIILIPLLICGGIFMLGMAQGIVDIANNEIALNNTAEYIENSTNYAENTTENIVESKEPKYVIVENFANPDTFYDIDWTPKKYVEYKVEEDGTYLIETNERVGANYLVYIVDEPISDLGKYQGDFEIVQHTEMDHKTLEKEVKKGQYIYLIQGDSKKGSVYIKKLDTN